MNIRYRVICERIKARARAQEWEPRRVFSVPPATEEEIRVTEEALGFPLPPMLRTLYLEVANGGDNLIRAGSGYWMVGARTGEWREDDNEKDLTAPYSQHNSLELDVSRTGWRFRPETVAALRRYRGAYVGCEDDEGFTGLPDGFEFLAFMGCSVGLYLDSQTGFLYLEDCGHVSFCAPSVEDWLERNLDAPLAIQASYQPHIRLEAAIAGEESHDIADESLTPAQVTKRLREENLSSGDADPDPLEAATKSYNIRSQNLAELSDRYPPALMNSIVKDERTILRDARIKSIGLKMWRERQNLVRYLYELMDVLEDEIAEADDEPVGEERFINCLMPLIEAEANLAHMTWDIQMGLSGLFAHSRRDWRTGKVYPDTDQSDH